MITLIVMNAIMLDVCFVQKQSSRTGNVIIVIRAYVKSVHLSTTVEWIYVTNATEHFVEITTGMNHRAVRPQMKMKVYTVALIVVYTMIKSNLKQVIDNVHYQICFSALRIEVIVAASRHE